MSAAVRLQLPMLLSWSRLLSVVPLHFLAMAGEMKLLAFGLILAGLTDVLDGYLARRWSCGSGFGSRLDSVADNALGLAVTGWVVVLCPGASDHLGLGCYIVLATAAPSVLGWLLYRRLVALHTYSARAAAVCAYATAVYVFWGDLTFGPTQRILLASAVTLKALDELLILLLVDGSALDQQRSIITYWSVGRSRTSLSCGNGDESGVA
ncbi:MAG TPA: CDP-alcohol phosphatidyltransferase family protein [Bryobacteraceae bacterium]|nr:CDP-alcohol phosphatidyltransferase family protein [Bryobacteraceae bacterium]